MKRLRILFLAAVLPFLCGSNLLAGAARTFVSTINGSDMNPCTHDLPCRSFAAAIPQTTLEGEVIALDSGGYGPVSISFALSIIAPGGVYAGITAFSGNAVTIDIGNGGWAHALLKNLYLNSQGADLGILVNTATTVHVEGCVINGFSEGILFNPTTANSHLYVRNTVIRRSNIGIYVIPGTALATLESVRLYSNDSGVEVDNGEATIRKSVVSGPGTYGFRGESGSRFSVEDTAVDGNAYGFYANNGTLMTATRCLTTSNTTAGIHAQFSSTVFVSDSTISANNVGVDASNGGAILSRCTDVLTGAPPPPCPAGHFTNTLLGNTTDGTFSGSYTSN